MPSEFKPKVLAFAGSLRADSLNKKLVKIAIKGAEERGAEVTYIDLKEYPLPVYDGDVESAQGLPENALKLKKLLLAHEGLLISCPEYNSSISGALKNMIDWTTRMATPNEEYLCCFNTKVVALLSASPSPLGGLRGLVHVRALLENIYSIVLPKQKCIPLADKAFDAQGNLSDAKQREEVLNIGRDLVTFLQKHKAVEPVHK